MKNLDFNDKNRNKKWFMGKGFYIALAASIIAIGIASYIAVDLTISNLNNDDNDSNNNLNNWGSPTDQVDNNQSNVEYNSSSGSTNNPANNPNATSSSNTTSSKVNTSSEVKKAVFAMPVKGEILNKFSNGELVKSKTLGDWRTHDGIDIKASSGSSVKAIGDGKVLEVKEDGLWGVVVVIEHSENYISYYNGLNKTVNIKKGQQVKIGDVIGTVGETAEIEVSEESHLHLGLKKDDKWVDPLSIINNP